jgi:transketolase
MRSAVVRTLAEQASSGVDVHFLTADLGFKVLDPFREAHPARFTNVGVSEANMVTVAAGMALAGKRPVCYSMVPFLLMRAFEHVRLDIAAHKLPVLLIGVGGGLSYGHEGISHHAIEDIAIMRSLPGLQLFAPGDPHEAAAAVQLALRHDGPTFIRLGQNNDPSVHAVPVDELHRPIRVRGTSGAVVVFATGHILGAARTACDRLASSCGEDVSLYSIPRLKPFDAAAVAELTANAKLVATIEEHSIIGGLGTAVMEVLFERHFDGHFERIGLPDAYCETHGTLPWLRKQYGLDPDSVAQRLQEPLR